MNTHQKEAIANANAHLGNAVLPTYDDLVKALLVANIVVERLRKKLKDADLYPMAMKWDQEINSFQSVLTQARNFEYIVINKSDQCYSVAGNETWVADAHKAHLFSVKADADAIAQMHQGTTLLYR